MLSMFFVCHRGMPSAVFYVSNLLTTWTKFMPGSRWK
jgi:hypothetical protein